MKKVLLSVSALVLAVLISGIVQAQDRKDKASFKPSTNEYYEQIQKAVDVFHTPAEPEKQLHMRMDLTGIDVPKSAAEFKTVFAGQPVSQGETGTCWCFSTTSFYESEIKRLSKLDLQLAPLFTVYWQYVEKTKEFIRTRGSSNFDEGSETNGVMITMKKYGIVPLDTYTGMKMGQPYHDHRKMVEEMKAYLQGIKTSNAWNEETAVSTIRSIMNFYMGEPPVSVTVGDKKMTPLEYMKNVTKLNPDDYVDFMSLMEAPFWTQAEYKVADNWWHSKDYYNVPVNDFMSIIKTAIKNGYSMSIGGDVSESGMDNQAGVAMIPSYDIPSSFIDDNARQLRFSNGATTDDHAMHLVGYEEKPNGTWFLIKDSGSGGHNNKTAPGYWYMHEDFIKLKMMTITLNKEAVKDVLTKFKK